MDKLLYTAMNSASTAMKSQTAIAHNLANANTPGFKSHFNSYSSWYVDGPGLNTRVMSQQNGDALDLSAGPITTSGRELDVALNGKGYITVQREDGGEGYTRAGDLRLDKNGMLTTGAGFSLIGNSGPISIPPAEKIEIGLDGSISILPVGQATQSLVIVDRIKLVNPDESKLIQNSEGLLQLPGDVIEFPDVGVTLESGVLELSNVNAVGQMIELISNARQFESSIKLMNEAKTMDEASARLLRNS